MKGIFIQQIDPELLVQVFSVKCNPAIDFDSVAIMPDGHVGKGCVIGFTGKFKNGLVVPNIVGVDIGCGVITYPLGTCELNLADLDEFIRNTIPTDFKCRSKPIDSFNMLRNKDEITAVVYNADRFLREHGLTGSPMAQLGTLGGGNHFIEIEIDFETKEKFLTIHSGSRNFGKQVADYFQSEAIAYCAKNDIKIQNDQAFCPDSEYLREMYLAQRYAHWNRLIMLWDILKFLKISFDESKLIISVHNYIDPEDGIVRKGAIKAELNKQVVIPLNMGNDGGILLGYGKGNDLYNNSGPHGAGRVMSRSAAKRLYDSSPEKISTEILNSMNGIYCKHTPISEAAFVYKPLEDIIEMLKQTIKVEKHLKPIYCFKGL